MDRLCGLRWLEIGSGDHPTDGYAHLDLNNGASHLEIHADALKIPLEDNSIDRILSIHLIEHFNQFDLIPLLGEWYRLLSPGGEIEIHSPDFSKTSAAFLAETDISRRMLIGQTILGFGEHRSVLDLPLLRACMEAVGFVEVHEIEGEDRHDLGWKNMIPGGFSLKVGGRKL